MLVDTHCHIHSAGSARDDFTVKKWHDGGVTDPDKLVGAAKEIGVTQLICVGTDLEDSKAAVQFVQSRENCWASVGAHPHDAKELPKTDYPKLEELLKYEKIVAVGECGLDFYYEHSPKVEQIGLLEFQLDLAKKHNLPVILHVREAYADFWPIFDRFPGPKGVVHSFTGTKVEAEQALSRGLYIGLNGIMTFTKDEKQLEMAKNIPLDRILTETDAPYLTPTPYRGKICKPEHVRLTAEFLAQLRGEDFGQFEKQTTKNAQELFGLVK